MTPTTFAYLDYQQGEQTIESPMYASLRLNKCYSFNPVPEGVDAKYILGGQGNLWCEQIVTMPYVEYMIWPRGWALAEDFWSPDATKNWDSFIQRVEKHFIRAEKAGVNYSTAIYDPVINIKKSDNKLTADITCEAPGLDVYYTLDGSMPGIYSPKYNKPIDIPDGPVTLKLAAYRNGKQIGHLISLKPADLKNRE
jgi:hexosaminidase